MKNGEQLNSEINFFYNDSKTTIQCLKNQSMKEIFKTISSQKNLDYNSLSFLYFEEEINQELSLNEFEKQKSIENSKMNILILEKNNYITSIYNINENKNENMLILGYGFVEHNKNNCKIVYNNTEHKLCAKININENNNKNILKIILIGINTISDASFMFSQCNSLLSLPDISKCHTINVTNMSNMFQECFSLSSLPDISSWNTSNVKDMKYMFYGCLSLLYLPDISKWDTSNVNNMSYMFDSCESLSLLPDISKWNTSKVTSTSNMFFHCKSLTYLPDISKWDMGNVKDFKYMFFNCISLSKKPDISKWKTNNAISLFVFGYCINLISKLNQNKN